MFLSRLQRNKGKERCEGKSVVGGWRIKFLQFLDYVVG